MPQKSQPELVIRNVLLVEKNNQGVNLTLAHGLSSIVPIVGDAFQLLKTDDSGEYCEYLVVHRIFREVTADGASTAVFDAIGVVIHRPLQWKP